MASVVDICNGALNQLGASTKHSITEDSKNARLCNDRYTKLTNNSSMKILYVARIEDPNEYDELLRETISAALAADIAYAVTSSNPVSLNMYNLYQTKLKDARFVDATEGQNTSQEDGMADVVDANDFLSSRF